MTPRAAGRQELVAAGSSHTGSGAPSQQFAFMWQCGQSQRVAIGSNSLPQ